MGVDYELVRLCLIFVLICLILAGCSSNESQIEVSEPVIMGTAMFDDYALILRLFEGRYEGCLEIGPDFGSNWVGQYELLIVDILNREIISRHQLTEWDDPLCFHDNIELKLTDLNSDGCQEVLIGQYAANNYNIYRMYYIDKDLQIGYYSEIGAIEMSSQDLSPQLEVTDGKVIYPVYDNVQGSMITNEMDIAIISKNP